MKIIEAIKELNAMGYSLEVCNGNITYNLLSNEKPNLKRVAELFNKIGEHHQEAVAYLTNKIEYAFVPITQNIEIPFKESSTGGGKIVTKDYFLKALENVLLECNSDTYIIHEFRCRFSFPFKRDVEYPIMLRYNNEVLMLKSYDTIRKYIRKNLITFRYYKAFQCLTMIFI